MEKITENLLEGMDVVINGGRASKKLITYSEAKKFASSANMVMSNEDLLIEILLRLPVFSLLLFKSVSKRWLCLITDLTFTRSQIRNLDPPSGLYLQRHCYTVEYDFVPFDIRIPPNKSPFPTSFTFRVDAGNVEILQSCNGLFLCSIGFRKFYVYNPSINRIKIIPLGPSKGYTGGFKMAFDPTKSPHYKIICTGDIIHDHVSPIQIYTYSSETCNWRVCPELSMESFRGFSNGIYWNDAIHWLNGSWHYKLDVDHLVLITIQTPKSLDENVLYDQIMFESHGCLLLVCMDDPFSRNLHVFEMRNGYSLWSMKYLIEFDNIMMSFPNAWKMSRFCFNVLSIVVGETEDDSFLVLELSGEVVQYKFLLKTLLKLYDLGSICPPVMKPSSFHSFLFIPSFAGV